MHIAGDTREPSRTEIDRTKDDKILGETQAVSPVDYVASSNATSGTKILA